MKKTLIHLLAALIPVSKYRKKFRNRFLLKKTINEILEDQNEFLQTLNTRISDNHHIIEMQQEKLEAIREEQDKLKFQFNIFLNHYVDISKVIPAGGLMRQIQKERLDVLNKIIDILEANSIDYWLDGGTLLGAVRHESFIPWDDDIDIGIFEKDKLKTVELINASLMNSNLEIIDASKLRNFPKDCFYKIIYKKTNYELLDIFVFDVSKKYKNAYYKVWWEESTKSSDYISKPPLHFSADTLLPLSKIKFENRTYFAPNNPIKYVELQYGNYQAFPQMPYEKVVLSELKGKIKEDLDAISE